MIHGAVVALAIVFPHQLPVAFLDNGRLEGHPRVGQAMRGEVRLELSTGRSEVGRLGAQADEYAPGHALTVHGLETELRPIKSGAHLSRGKQTSVELVGPLMVGANQLWCGAARFGAEPRPAVPTTIDECSNDPVSCTCQEDWVSAYLQRQVAACPR